MMMMFLNTIIMGDKAVDREWMVMMLDIRIKELKEEYRMYVNKWDKQRSKEIKEGHARNMRSKVKFELNLCQLISLLLKSSNVTFIADSGAIDGFQRLVAPVDKRR